MVKLVPLREIHNLEEEKMEPIKFLMTDTGAGCTAACKAALEAKGVEVHV